MTENIKDALSYAVELAGKENKIIRSETGKEYFDSNEYDYRNLILVSMHLSLSFRRSRVLLIISSQITISSVIVNL